MSDFSKSDWKKFRDLREAALERLCERILAEAVECAKKPDASNHQRYLDLFKLIQQRDKDIGDAFNDARRSRALIQLFCMVNLGLVDDAELEQFSQETRDGIARWREVSR